MPRQQRGGQKPSDAAFPALARLPGARKPLIVGLQAADVARLVAVGPNMTGQRGEVGLSYLRSRL